MYTDPSGEFSVGGAFGGFLAASAIGYFAENGNVNKALLYGLGGGLLGGFGGDIVNGVR